MHMGPGRVLSQLETPLDCLTNIASTAKFCVYTAWPYHIHIAVTVRLPSP